VCVPTIPKIFFAHLSDCRNIGRLINGGYCIALGSLDSLLERIIVHIRELAPTMHSLLGDA
jgi:hypothetical protein